MRVYKLTNGKKQGAFQLPLKNEMAVKIVDGEKRLKKIQYIIGSDSIFAEDYKGDEKPTPVWFEDGEIRVSENNWALNEIMTNHAWFKKHYVLVDEEATAKIEVEAFEAITKASNAIIMENDEHKLRAMAMCVISLEAADWETYKCKAQLLIFAKNHSNVMLAEMAKPDYEARYIAALAFTRELVKYNLYHTAVIWAKNEGIIVRVAEGENGIDKLGAFLSKDNESSEGVLKELGALTEELFADDVKKENPQAQNAKMRKDIEAEMRKDIEAEMRKNIEAEVRREIEAENIEVNQDKKELDSKVYSEENLKQLTLEDLQNEYTRITEKNLSPKYAKDKEWMIEKIISAQS